MKINETLVFIYQSVKIAYSPKKIINYAQKTDFKQIFTHSVILLIIFSFILCGVLILNDISYSVEKQIYLILGFCFLAIMFIPSFFITTLKLKFTSFERFKISLFLSVNYIVFYLSIPIICYFLFLQTENYFFYYLFFLLYFVVIFIALIILPVLLNKKWAKVFITFFSLLIFVLVNITFSNITDQKEIDPIFLEIEQSDVINKSHFDSLLETGNLMIENYQSYLSKKDFFYLQQILNEEKSIDLLKNDLDLLKTNLVFRTSKDLVITSIEAATSLQRLISQVERIIEIDKSYKNSLDNANKTLADVQSLLNLNQKLISTNEKEILAIQDRIQNHQFEITIDEALAMENKLHALQDSYSKSNNDAQRIDEMLLIVEQEQDKVEKYIVYLEKLVDVTKEINTIVKDYNEITKRRMVAMQKIVSIYKLKNIFLF